MYISIHIIQIRNDLDDVNLHSPFLFQFICTDDCTFSELFYMYPNMLNKVHQYNNYLFSTVVNEDPLLLPFNTCYKLTKALHLITRAFVLLLRSVHFFCTLTLLNKVQVYAILSSDNIDIPLSIILVNFSIILISTLFTRQAN